MVRTKIPLQEANSPLVVSGFYSRLRFCNT